MAALGYRWQDLYPNLNTRTRYPMAETWDLKMYRLATRHPRLSAIILFPVPL